MDKTEFQKLPKQIQKTINKKIEKDTDLMDLNEAFQYLKSIEKKKKRKYTSQRK